MTQDTEQFRVGFEADYTAWMKRAGASDEYVFLTLQRNSSGDYSTVAVQARWEGWTASKREASTEPTTTSTSQAAAAVAYAVVSVRAGIHKLAITKESADRKAAKWREEWPNNGCSVRPLVFADESGSSQGDALDAQCWRYIEEHATTHGGGHGFTITCFVPVDHEDMQCGILSAIAASNTKGE